MTIITVRSNRSPGYRSGFTLVEVLIATSLSSMLFAAIFSSFIFIGRSSLSIANYSAMNSESRFGLETFGRDVRAAETIRPGFSATEFTIDVTGEGGAVETIAYSYLPSHPDRPLMRRDSVGTKLVMTGVEKLNFTYYNLQAGEAKVPIEVKQVQLELTLVRNAMSLQNTEKIVSARFILRNKKVSN